MTHTIYKYPVFLQDSSSLVLPAYSRILSVGRGPDGAASLWALVQPQSPATEEWELRVLGTGNPVPDDVAQADTRDSEWRFLGTLAGAGEPFVWHVFARRLP